MYTYKIEQAIKAAALLHQDHLRKGTVPLPYITHLMAVTMIVRDYTSDENTIAAALLHDTLEDTDYTPRELREDFGETIAVLVETLTEPPLNGAEKFTWLSRKKQYGTQLRNGPLEAVVIAAADKAHNFRSIVDEYGDNHSLFLQDFGTNLAERLEAYQHIANAINNRLEDGIVHEFNHTFTAYKNFILDVQKTIN